VGYRAETNAGWSLIVEQDYDEVFAPLRAAQQQALIFLAITIFVSILVAYFIFMRIARPIKHLTEIADGISKGKFSGEKIVEDQRGDEIGSLARAIERMGRSIQIAFRKLKEKE
jgi:methyl-accepting chemotaxis protein